MGNKRRGRPPKKATRRKRGGRERGGKGWVKGRKSLYDYSRRKTSLLSIREEKDILKGESK